MQQAIEPGKSAIEPGYWKYRCTSGDPLSCTQCHPRPLQETQTQETQIQETQTQVCETCNFPSILPQQAHIRGVKATYEIDAWLGKRGQGRLYRGHQLPDEQPIMIKEYVLPTRTFNETSLRQRKQAFKRLAGLELADGRSQDFRLIVPDEAIADPQEQRCYLITHGDANAYPTLQSQLETYGAMTNQQVRRLLEQVLQTLEFLNRQKFRFPNGQVKLGLAHGNLNLETLLIRNGNARRQYSAIAALDVADVSEAGWHENFLIYVCDLGLWEFLFAPPTIAIPEPTIADDLKALGQTAVALLAGGTTDRESNQPLDPTTGQPLPPTSPSTSAALQDYLLRLLGISVPFESAEAARQALLRLPPETFDRELAPTIQLEQERAPKRRLPWKTTLVLLLLLFSGGLLWWWVSRLMRTNPTTVLNTDQSLCCVQDVAGIPAGNFTYTAEKTGTWSYTLLQPNLVEADKTLEAVLRERQPKLELAYQPQASTAAAIAQVRSRQADFLITSLPDQATADMSSQDIAYDGLSVFVAFSYAMRTDSLPRFLNGKITFDQLRQLYTGKIKNWKALQGPDLAVKLYIPTEAEAVQLFEQKVLKDRESIAQFRSLQTTGEITTQPSFATFRQVIQDFEAKQVGAIAFGPISQVFGQCSVYPLAIVDSTGIPVQALIEDDGSPITPATNLCAAKGSYDRSVALFQTGRYPLSYALAVLYLKDNRQQPVGQKFAELLQTEEGQRLLNKTGLIPLQPLSKR